MYAAARYRKLIQRQGTRPLTTERMFEQLYRIARELEMHPHRMPALLMQLLQKIFEPLEAVFVAHADNAAHTAHAVVQGSALVVPVPEVCFLQQPIQASCLQLRHAQQGRRPFTADDARLADCVVEQLRRAVAFDRAVEQGRSEERLRLAQDLHDDIGARLLTLMYKSTSPEMEDYIRHTLQDLKTLTRGLAHADHRLAHAASDWKADLTQRLSAAHIELVWQFEQDDDVVLSMVQWSGLTRVLRELISNVIAHAGAQRVKVALQLRNGTLALSVCDDGAGGDPRQWAHGLGLGGIRKRVKQLGGEVQWQLQPPHGICCSVHIKEFCGRVAAV